MNRRHCVALLTGLLFLLPLLAQETDGFFSGTIAEMEAGKITVSRTILSKAPEKHMFIVNEETKVEGKMKAKSRVTVRYVPSDDGDVAVSIIVRTSDKNDKKRP